MMNHISCSTGDVYQGLRRQPLLYSSAARHSAFPPSRPMNQSRMANPLYQERPNYYVSTPVSPTNSADEVEAAAALISLPGRKSSDAAASRSTSIPARTINFTDADSHTEENKTNGSYLYQPTLHSSTTSSRLYPPPSIKRVVATHFPPATLSSTAASTPDTASVSSNEDSIPLVCLPATSSTAQQEEECYYTGSTSLSLPQDDNVLSPLHCFLRRYCVEAFSATQDHVATPRYGKSHGGKIVLDQVGIRCLFCKSLPVKPERAVCYPSSLKNIYHSIETWQRRHAPVCTAIPPWIKRELTSLIETSRTTAGGRRQYWQDAAQQVGLVDTPQGVRFAQPPGIPVQESNTCSFTSSPSLQQESTPSLALVSQDDACMVTEFLFVLMQQMETCAFQEEDRTGGRSKVKDYPVGFGGMQCKHCRGMAGFGRYFPSSINALALANSDRNVYNHVKKCRKCPESIKQELLRLYNKESVKNKRGSRKQFFTRIWDRIHHQE